MTKTGLLSAVLVSLALISFGSGSALASSSYPAPSAVAGQLKVALNKNVAAHGYAWKYRFVVCKRVSTGTQSCSAYGRIRLETRGLQHAALGLGLDRTAFDVTTTATGDWSATTEWNFAGGKWLSGVQPYPGLGLVAQQLKNMINKGATKNGDLWRYRRVSCSPNGQLNVLLCSGTGYWAFGRGSVMDRSSWNVITTRSATWTAASKWTFAGHVGAV